LKISTWEGLVSRRRDLAAASFRGAKWLGGNGLRGLGLAAPSRLAEWLAACNRISAGSKRDANRDEKWAGPEILNTEDIMKATKKAKSAKKVVMHKGKSLEAVKPLTKIAAGPHDSSPAPTGSISLPYSKIEYTYKS
jgi:hypothetical protein